MKNMFNTIRLYKPLSPLQLEEVINSGWSSFAVDSPLQKVFYPKIHRRYAENLARQWDAVQFNAGYVVAFDVPTEFMAKYEIQTTAYEEHREYVVPVEELSLFNQNIKGKISVVTTFKRENDCVVEQECDSGSLLDNPIYNF
jgi:hypothetical protein